MVDAVLPMENLMLSLRFALIPASLMFAVGCGGYSSPSTSPSQTPSSLSQTPSPAPPPGAPSSSVSIPMGASTLGNRAFAPDDVDVAAGTTVTWMNSDSVAHTSTSDVNGWDSGTVEPGGRFSVAFPTAGTYRYHCAIHPGMVGTV